MGFGVVAGSAQENSADTLHIGVLAPLSGPFLRLGLQVEQGVALAVLDARDQGLSVQVTAVDDACDEERGRAAANQLVGAGVDAVVGGVCWRPAVAARDVLSAESIPMYASSVRFDGFTDDADGAVLRISGRDDQQAASIVTSLVSGELDELLGASVAGLSLVIFHSEAIYGRTLADEVQAELEQAGIDVALVEPFNAEDGLRAAALRADAEEADLAVVFAGQADSALLIAELRAQLPDLAVLAGDSVMTAEFSLLADGAAEGVVFPRPTPWRTLAMDEVLAEYEGASPGVLAGLTLPSMAAAQVAIAEASGNEAPFDTVIGPISFNDVGDANVPSFQMWQWRDGFIRPLANAAPASR
ncbi:MAG: ABC transporter substrate-binding protein [Pseudomonadota bacterium]